MNFKQIILMFILSISLQADIYNEAREAYKNGDYTKAKSLLKKDCNNGHINSCHNLGYIYAKIDKDWRKALKLFKYACDNGNNSSCKFIKAFNSEPAFRAILDYNKYLKNDCGFSCAKLAAKHSQDEWTEIMSNNKLREEIKSICPNSKPIPSDELLYYFKFLIEYANDSGNIPSC
jgi:TPR repeat protein